MPESETLSLVGAVGGAGTTRLAVEFAGTLARDGRDVAVLDAAYATQGLAQYVDGRIDPDITALCLDDDPLAAGLVDLQVDHPGRVALCPAFAPFERVARAKTPEAARAFEDHVERAAGWFDHVLVDTPPVAANQAVAAVNAADRAALVTPATRRGLDALPRAGGRLADVGVAEHDVIVNRVPGSTEEPVTIDEPGAGPDGASVEAPDVVVPESRNTEPTDAPTVLEDGTFAGAVGTALETVLGVELDLAVSEAGPLARLLSG